MLFADLYIDYYYGRKTFFDTSPVYFFEATPNCSFPRLAIPTGPRTLFYNLSGASIYATKNSVSGYTTSSPDTKPPVMFPVIVTMRGTGGLFGRYSMSHAAMKLGISIVYAVQYGSDDDHLHVQSYQFEDICPPYTIPNAQWILNP